MAGIYIHIPFCKQACHYCNFHFATSLHQQKALVEALIKEIELQKDYLQRQPLLTLYFGGGTPSLLPEAALNSLLSSIKHWPFFGKSLGIWAGKPTSALKPPQTCVILRGLLLTTCRPSLLCWKRLVQLSVSSEVGRRSSL